jgi:hypothetical protein
MHKSVLLAIGGLALVAASGASAELRAPGELLAQASPPGSTMDRERPGVPPGSPTRPQSDTGSPGASPSAPGAGAASPGASPTSPGVGAASAAEWKGKPLVDSSGDKIGEVKDVQGQNVIVSTGGFLGMGSKDVQISRDRLTVSGSGNDMKLQTSMTKEQIKDLPEHKAPGSATTPAPAGGTTPSR